jgi:hypothetical protein
MPTLEETIRLAHDVHLYPNRTARVVGAPLTIPRETLRSLEAKLAEAAKTRMDNHTVYRITSRNGQVLYLWFHDLLVYIGTSVEEGRY